MLERRTHGSGRYADAMGATKRILILGGGYIGLYCAMGLEKRLSASEASITLVSPESFMLYQSFLPEAASGNIEPRHVVVPLRQALSRTRLMTGRVTGLDHDRRIATVRPLHGADVELDYDIVVIGVGSISRVLDVPGLEEPGTASRRSPRPYISATRCSPAWTWRSPRPTRRRGGEP